MAPFVFEYRVRVSDTDLMRVMHHQNYPRIFEWAREEFFRRIGHSFESHVERGRYLAVLSISYQMHAPARHGQVLGVKLRIRKVTKARIDLAYQVTDAETGQVIVTGSTQHAVLDDHGKVVRIPDGFLDDHVEP